MKKKTTTIICILMLMVCNISTQSKSSEKLRINNIKTTKKAQRGPVPIYYGLNASHSNSWAQCTKDGLIGISYFKTNGDLIYKTIQPDGAEKEEIVMTGFGSKISVLLLDSNSNPHIFVASSSLSDQVIDHYYKSINQQWEKETIIRFNFEGGRFIYELSADLGPNDTFHLAILKTRSNPDSDDYFYAFQNAHLYHLTNAGGTWEKELIHNYDTNYTLDEYVKILHRQDIKVDNDGNVHIVFGEQINALSNLSPSRLCYATNKSGNWVIETAVNYVSGSRDSAGWYPSLCLDNQGQPHISCTYVGHYPTGSATHAKLLFVSRIGSDNWNTEVIATSDDGYYGFDGQKYTGGLAHLVFDKDNTPHIIFSDIASSHGPRNYLNLGNIRYAVFQDGIWDISTIYRQPLPGSYTNATEMYGMCLLIAENTNKIRVIGQECNITGSGVYQCKLINIPINETTHVSNTLLKNYDLQQNYPNPFDQITSIHLTLKQKAFVELNIFNMQGQLMKCLARENLTEGKKTYTWNGTNHNGQQLSNGTYFLNFSVDGQLMETKKMFLFASSL